tara:strand:- start:211 stop:342 length:132 start_codon:yes stop_codon:yes gene_type:complete
MKKEREDFMRIAQAQIAKHYPYLTQRVAVAAKMYVKYMNRRDQ